MNKPNIFNIATKELNQDAFITWLLLFGDCAYEQNYPELNECSRQFITALLRQQYPDFNENITTVSAKRQYEKIDIWVLVNGRYRLIIEDKTNTSQHNNQLNRYREIAEKDCHKHGYPSPICIYLKTGNQSAGSLKNVIKDGFHTFLRQDFLAILEQYPNIQNDIYQDFLARLRMLEQKNQAFKNKLISEWNGSDWQGLFQFLDEYNLLKSWKYVNNKAGGLWCAVLVANQSVYLQIESKEAQLCFKIKDKDKQTSTAKKYYNYLKLCENSSVVCKPKKFGKGKSMTAAVIPCEHWLGNPQNTFNPEFVLQQLNDWCAFFNQTATQFHEINIQAT